MNNRLFGVDITDIYQFPSKTGKEVKLFFSQAKVKGICVYINFKNFETSLFLNDVYFKIGVLEDNWSI